MHRKVIVNLLLLCLVHLVYPVLLKHLYSEAWHSRFRHIHLQVGWILRQWRGGVVSAMLILYSPGLKHGRRGWVILRIYGTLELCIFFSRLLYVEFGHIYEF